MSTNIDNPITDFSGCHEGILEEFTKLKTLPMILGEPDTLEDAKQAANDLRRFFKKVVKPHHDDEELELFKSVRGALKKHPEKAMAARGYIARLIEEHRYLEKTWKSIDKTLKKITKGKTADLDVVELEQFANDYLSHAEFEEQYFLPLAEEILSSQDKSKLGMSLHIRHLDIPAQNYI